jgi:hypothetical protein
VSDNAGKQISAASYLGSDGNKPLDAAPAATSGMERQASLRCRHQRDPAVRRRSIRRSATVADKGRCNRRMLVRAGYLVGNHPRDAFSRATVRSIGTGWRLVQAQRAMR